MFSCAGVCSYEGRGGLCSIRLSLPLLKLRPRKDLIETLLHEMIHAFLFVTQRNRDRDGHGPEFQYHMHRINQMANTKITIYHSFHDEVAVYKQHIWRCNGPCRDRRPFFGYVKRTCNRAPGPNDLWWKDHKASCNGTFIKIKEPEGFGQRKRKKTDENTSPEKKAIASNSLDRYFANLGRGQVIGTQNRITAAASSSNSAGSSKGSAVDSKVKEKTAKGTKQATSSKMITPIRKNVPSGSTTASKAITASQKDMSSAPKPQIIEIDLRITGAAPKTTPAVPSITTHGTSDCPIVIEDDGLDTGPSLIQEAATATELALVRNVTCPSCGESVVEYFINEHLDSCIYLQ